MAGVGQCRESKMRRRLATVNSVPTNTHTRTVAFVLGCIIHCADSIGSCFNVWETEIDMPFRIVHVQCSMCMCRDMYGWYQCIQCDVTVGRWFLVYKTYSHTRSTHMLVACLVPSPLLVSHNLSLLFFSRLLTSRHVKIWETFIYLSILLIAVRSQVVEHIKCVLFDFEYIFVGVVLIN